MSSITTIQTDFASDLKRHQRNHEIIVIIINTTIRTMRSLGSSKEEILEVINYGLQNSSNIGVRNLLLAAVELNMLYM